MSSEWLPNLQNEVTFVMIDSAGIELAGLALSIELRVTGGLFAPAAGAWSEIGSGWYSYICDPTEAVVGPISMKVTAVGAIQQNLEYVCAQRTPGVNFWPYLVTLPDNVTPISGVLVFVTRNAGGLPPIIWTGYTDTNGYAKDSNNNDPLLPLGNNYFWKYLPGYTDLQNPDLEVVV